MVLKDTHRLNIVTQSDDCKTEHSYLTYLCCKTPTPTLSLPKDR